MCTVRACSRCRIRRASRAGVHECGAAERLCALCDRRAHVGHRRAASAARRGQRSRQRAYCEPVRVIFIILQCNVGVESGCCTVCFHRQRMHFCILFIRFPRAQDVEVELDASRMGRSRRLVPSCVRNLPPPGWPLPARPPRRLDAGARARGQRSRAAGRGCDRRARGATRARERRVRSPLAVRPPAHCPLYARCAFESN